MKLEDLGEVGACTYFRKPTNEWVTTAEFKAHDESLYMTVRYAARFKWLSKLMFFVFFKSTVAKRMNLINQ